MITQAVTTSRPTTPIVPEPLQNESSFKRFPSNILPNKITLNDPPSLSIKKFEVKSGKQLALLGINSTIGAVAFSIFTHDLMNLVIDTPNTFEAHYMIVSASFIAAQILLLGLRIPKTQYFSAPALLLSSLVATHLNPSFESSALNNLIKISGVLLGGAVGGLIQPRFGN